VFEVAISSMSPSRFRSVVIGRSRVHPASLPMDDPAENAIIVNALQRHATVVTQKSLAELDYLRVFQNVLERSSVPAAA
jgi:trehalose synthase